MKSKYTPVILFSIMLAILLSGCGALLTALIQTVFASATGIVAIPAVIVAASRESNSPIPGMILLSADAAIPDGYGPAQEATVTIVNDDGSINQGITDINGRFNIANVPVGIKTIRIKKEGYVSIEQTTVVSFPDDGRPFSGFKIVPGSVSVSLYDKILKIPQTNFHFYTYGEDPNGIAFSPKVSWSVNDPAKIDSSGNFHTEIPGSYIVFAYSLLSSDLLGYTFIIVTALDLIVLGNVIDPSGNPIMDAKVNVPGNNLFCVTDARGFYIIRGVPFLNKKLTVMAEKDGKYGLTEVSVEDPNIPVNADIVIDPNVTVMTPTPEIYVTPTTTPTGIATVTPTPLAGAPEITSITDPSGDNHDSSEAEFNLSFTIKGINFGPDKASVNGLVKFINTETGTVLEGTVSSWSGGEIAGNVIIPAGNDGRGKYLVQVTVLNVKSESEIYYYKGSGSYNISIN